MKESTTSRTFGRSEWHWFVMSLFGSILFCLLGGICHALYMGYWPLWNNLLLTLPILFPIVVFGRYVNIVYTQTAKAHPAWLISAAIGSAGIAVYALIKVFDCILGRAPLGGIDELLRRVTWHIDDLLPLVLISLFLLLSIPKTIKCLLRKRGEPQATSVAQDIPRTFIGNFKVSHPGICSAFIGLALLALFVSGFFCGRVDTETKWESNYSMLAYRATLARGHSELTFLRKLDNGNIGDLKARLNRNLNHSAVTIAEAITRYPENKDLKSLKSFLLALKRHRKSFPITDDDLCDCVKNELPQAFSLVE